MAIIVIVLELVGALGLFLYGMQVLSDSIQRAAGERLKGALNFMTGKPLAAVLTGIGVTTLVQSSSASTVMVVSFVNAGLLSLKQAIGVIFGANIGTTTTAWIVSLVGFKFSMSLIAVPLVGIGFVMATFVKTRRRVKDWGETLIGFGILFIGLDFLSHAIPKPGPEVLHFLAEFSNLGYAATLIGVLIGTLFTVLVHSSSASTAVFITLAVEGVVDFRLAAALVLGANIGTTIDAFLASIGTKVAARRTAWVHILFNVIGTVWAVALFGPFLKLVDLMWPGPVEANVAQHIAMLHTVFNTINTILFFPFMTQFTALVTRLVKEKPGEDERSRLVYVAAPIVSSPELNLLTAQKEIADMAGLARDMFARVRDDTRNPAADHAANLEEYGRLENYADQMREELARFLLECAGREMSETSQNNVGLMLRIVDDLESVTDQAYSLALIIERTRKKGIALPKDEIDSLQPYGLIVEQFLRFVSDNVNKPITEEQLAVAAEYEDKIDAMRDELKRRARKRLSAGAEVKAELAIIDLVRHIEKIGDHAFGVARALREFR